MSDESFCKFVERTITSLAAESGLTADSAKSLAARLISKVRETFGCERIYVQAASREARNLDILADHDCGLPRRKIAEKHGISLSTVDRIVGRHRLPTRPPTQGRGLARDDRWLIR